MTVFGGEALAGILGNVANVLLLIIFVGSPSNTVLYANILSTSPVFLFIIIITVCTISLISLTWFCILYVNQTVLTLM